IWNSKNGRVAGVASRDLRRSRRFIKECQAQAPFEPAPRAFGSYEELLATPDVDAVYIPRPTGIRGYWVKRAAEAGKHVVCEKPCATTAAELGQMIDACRRNQVQFMDGVMFMHSRRLERMRELLSDGKAVGGIRRIASAFSFRADEEFFASNIRAQSELEPHGCLGDLGWYCIRFSLWAMNWKLPVRATGQILSEFKHKNSESPVATEFSAELFFEDGVSSSFYCSFLTENEQWAMISGTQGHLWVPDFVLPFSGTQITFDTGNPVFNVQGCDFEMQPNARQWVVKERSHSHPTAQESQMFHNFADQVRSGTLNPAWPDTVLKTQTVMQVCLESSLKRGRPINVDPASGA
ncbi:MAG: Gfo/Idh/MocA family oxidoreductase, partial [Verrucomicrobia bacterium]|nr:Gfo/Idh/MocA family oxidoreductase [Verrucomicrobiota bacterium]